MTKPAKTPARDSERPNRHAPDSAAAPKTRKTGSRKATSRKTDSRKADSCGAGDCPRKSALLNKSALLAIELISLAAAALTAIIILLGHWSARFSGTSFFGDLLPFAGGILILMLLASVFVLGWWRLRKRFNAEKSRWIPVMALVVAALPGWYVMQDGFGAAYANFRLLVGGSGEAGRLTLAHQVYAGYRRFETLQVLKLIARKQTFDGVISEAALAFDLDPHLLQGIAAAESSFLPRASKDGGRGLFQITAVPRQCLAEANDYLNSATLSLANPRHNALVAAATLKYYLKQMHNDLFLGLLAYNIGPANGGLKFIMEQYGARDFVTIQPYLKNWPRDYPIRVLAYALAFRIWQREGRLLPYEQGTNALRIQRIGIPGLQTLF